MAKKDRLANLLDSVGNDIPQEKEREQRNSYPPIAPELTQELNLNAEQEEALNKIRKANLGRPRESKTGEAKPRKDRATFVISKEITRKLKYIALMETRLHQDVVAEALTAYIEQWESKNGTINLPKCKEL